MSRTSHFHSILLDCSSVILVTIGVAFGSLGLTIEKNNNIGRKLLNHTLVINLVAALFCLFKCDESAAPVALAWLTASHSLHMLTVLFTTYRCSNAASHVFPETEHIVHAAAVLYFFSQAIDFANFLMTAFQVVPMTFSIQIGDISGLTEEHLSIQIEKAHAERGILATFVKAASFVVLLAGYYWQLGELREQ